MHYARQVSIITLLLVSNILFAQGVPPGCYCVNGAMRTVIIGEFLSPIVAGTQFSNQPCLTAFGQSDGSNCEACLCTSRENDAGILQIQTASLFTGAAGTGYSLNACEDILANDDTLLSCGPCPLNQSGNSCDTFIAPDPGAGDPNIVNSIPTLGEWSIILLTLGLLILAIVAIKNSVLSTIT